VKTKVYQIIFLGVLALITNANAQTSCVDYKTVGMTNCEPTEEVSLTPPPALPEPELTLDQKVDQYLEDYGKPPREFVEFSLEPTLENALKWAKKNQEIKERNRSISKAWGQAEAIINEYKKHNMEIPGFKYESDLPPVPDFGVPTNSQLFMQERRKSSVVPSTSIGRNIGEGIKTKDLLAEAEGKINISYYFSAECAFCKKFEPGFSNVLQELGKDKVTVICVDMTPSGSKISNVNGKIDCRWRPLLPGEAKDFEIVSTPTLIIDWGGKISKVEGYVPEDKLRKFLIRGN